MFNVKSFAALVLGAVMVFSAPTNAATFSGNISSGASVDVFAGPYSFAASYTNPDLGGVYNFTFNNGQATASTVALTVASVQQLGASYFFAGGVTFKWLTSGLSQFVAQGALAAFTFDNIIAANSSDTLRVTFGNPTVRNGAAATPFINLGVDAVPAAVPLPAGGLLLLSALGGIAGLRRRKAAV